MPSKMKFEGTVTLQKLSMMKFEDKRKLFHFASLTLYLTGFYSEYINFHFKDGSSDYDLFAQAMTGTCI
ncbi:hypothetical protein AHAS_Ahas05G0108600 [Arachis hypogaea]